MNFPVERIPNLLLIGTGFLRFEFSNGIPTSGKGGVLSCKMKTQKTNS